MDTLGRIPDFTGRQITTLQWGHALSGMDTIGNDSFAGKPKNQRFNGAMPFQAWILGINGQGEQGHNDASMGPCPFRHGYYSGETGSNPINLLQWGHALSGMDTSPA